MRLWLLFALWLTTSAVQDTPKGQGRFFNDSPKAVTFYIDDQFGCSVPANPEGNNAYCDAEIGYGKHTLSIRGPKLPSESCPLVVGENIHAEATLTKAERLYCRAVFGRVD